MLIKVHRNAKDTSEFHKEPNLSRRDFILKTATTGILSILGTGFILGERSYGAALNCPPSTLIPGGFGQVIAQDGCAPVPIFAPTITNSMNANMASNYGVGGVANLVQAGKNWMTDNKSPWGQVLLAGPPGVNAATWKAVLANTVVGANYGDMTNDDGSNVNGLPAGFAGINGRGGPNAKDFRFTNGSNAVPAKFAVGSSASIKTATPAALAATLSMTPAATGLTSSTDIAAASTAALAIEQAYESVNPISSRKGGANLLNSAGCGFNNNPPTASATYGTTSYTPGGIAAITNLVPAASITTMTTQNQAILAAAYQSATGFNGGVMMTNPNCDYHNNGGTPQGTGNQDLINATAVVAMLAGFAAANQPGAIIITSNGSVSCTGTGAATLTINGVATAVQGVQANNDNGGTFSQALLLMYHPAGTLPTPAINGTINTTTGSTKGASGNQANSMAGLMASALFFLNKGNIPNTFLTASALSATQLKPLMVVS